MGPAAAVVVGLVALHDPYDAFAIWLVVLVASASRGSSNNEGCRPTYVGRYTCLCVCVSSNTRSFEGAPEAGRFLHTASIQKFDLGSRLGRLHGEQRLSKAEIFGK